MNVGEEGREFQAKPRRPAGERTARGDGGAEAACGRGGCFLTYVNVQSLCWAPQTVEIVHISYTSINKAMDLKAEVLEVRIPAGVQSGVGLTRASGPLDLEGQRAVLGMSGFRQKRWAISAVEEEGDSGGSRCAEGKRHVGCTGKGSA